MKYGKGLLVQMKEGVYKITTKNEDEDCPFKKNKPHKKLNTQWGTVYSKDLTEFIKRNNGNVL